MDQETGEAARLADGMIQIRIKAWIPLGCDRLVLTLISNIKSEETFCSGMPLSVVNPTFLPTTLMIIVWTC